MRQSIAKPATRGKLSPLKKLELRIRFLTSADDLAQLAGQFGTTTATISRNTAGKGLSRPAKLNLLTLSKLWMCWNKEAKRSAGFTSDDFQLIAMLAFLRQNGGLAELVQLIEAKHGNWGQSPRERGLPVT